MTLGQRIQELRKQNGLSQEGLGEVLGVSRQAVSKWEGDNGIPELDTLIAMSRLFGVTIGELLGVETPVQAETADREAEDARIEEILRRYTRQSEQQKEAPVPRKWLLTGAAAAAAVLIVIAVLFAQLNALRTTVRYLRSEVSSLQVQVSNNLGSLSGQIRNAIYAVLEEQNAFVNTYAWSVADADIAAQNATVRLNATMKEYLADSQVQFLARWTKTDETTGEAASKWVSGPDFAAEISLPMNYHTEVSIRVKDAEGNIREQSLDTITGLHPDYFKLEAYDLMQPFAVTGRHNGITSTTTKGEDPHVEILSAYPHLFWPVKAHIKAAVNGETVFEEDMKLSTADGEDISSEELKEALGEAQKERFGARVRDGYFDLTLLVGDELLITLDVTDNLGRQEQFTYGGTMVYEKYGDIHLELAPMAAPALPVD